MKRKPTWLVSRPSSTTLGYVHSQPTTIYLTAGLFCFKTTHTTCKFHFFKLTLKKGLVKSNNRNEQQLGVRLLSEIFRVSPERRRECLYYLALGNYKLGNFGEARDCNDRLLKIEPANLQAQDLRQLIDAKVAKEGLVGMAILSGVSIAAGVVGAFLIKNAKKR